MFFKWRDAKFVFRRGYFCCGGRGAKFLFKRGYFCCGGGGVFEVEGCKVCVLEGVLLLWRRGVFELERYSTIYVLEDMWEEIKKVWFELWMMYHDS